MTTFFFLAALAWTAISFLSYRDWALFFQISSAAWVLWAVVWTAMRLTFTRPPKTRGVSRNASNAHQSYRWVFGIGIAACLAIFVFAVSVGKWSVTGNRFSTDTLPVALKTASERLSGEKNLRPPIKDKPEKNTRTERAPSGLAGFWSVQVGAFSSEQGATAVARSLVSKGYAAYVTRGEVKAVNVYRTNVGRFRTREEAERLLILLKDKEAYRTAFVARM